MNISELRSQDRELIDGKEVTLDGFFVMMNGTGYFVANRDERDSQVNGIFIDHPNLERCLLSSVPANGGSKYSYCTQAKITGTLKLHPSIYFFGCISNVHDFIVYLFDEPMVVSL